MKYIKKGWRVMRSLPVVVVEQLIVAKNWLYLNNIPKNGQTIIIGPWLSEVGFEVVYWIPFINWLINRYKFKGKIVVISRGGAKVWYGDTPDLYVDILDYYTPEELKQRNEQRTEKTKLQKQIRITGFDREMIEKVKTRYQLGKVYIIHPSIMYLLFNSFWYNRSSLRFLNRYSRYLPYKASSQKPKGIPASYIALKFYFSSSFPKTFNNVRFINALIKLLSKTSNIVVMNTNLQIDDHKELGYKNKKIFTIDHLMTPQNNLDIQTQILSGAKAFFGTYGGFSYIPPFLGVPSYSFYSNSGNFNRRHLDAANNAYQQLAKHTGKKTIFKVSRVLNIKKLINNIERRIK